MFVPLRGATPMLSGAFEPINVDPSINMPAPNKRSAQFSGQRSQQRQYGSAGKPSSAPRPESHAVAGNQASVWLHPGREKSLQRQHPWIFSGAVERVDGDPTPGSDVLIRTSEGKPLAVAAYSPRSQICARVWSFDPTQSIDDGFLLDRIQRAIAARSDVSGNGTRLVHAEADGLPGLIVDRYADVLVMQCSTWGMEVKRERIVRLLLEATDARAVFERSDSDTRRLEGLDKRCENLHGNAGSTAIELDEDGVRYLVDVVHGHKTGFYLDQRDHRALIRRLAKGRRVLDCFCYQGGFSLAASAGGATQVLAIDSSEPSLVTARANAAHNNLGTDIEWRNANAFEALREIAAGTEKFDLIVLDPPKLAPTAAHADRAARAYKDANLHALRALAPGGLLATFSCSGGVSPELFQKIVAGAASDAGVQAQIITKLGQPADHPIALSFPESEYLKGLLLRRASW